jgi:hypothetical protein
MFGANDDDSGNHIGIGVEGDMAITRQQKVDWLW